MTSSISQAGQADRISNLWLSAKQRIGQQLAAEQREIPNRREIEPRPAQFRRLGRSQVQWDNLLARLSRSFHLPAGPQALTVTATPAEASARLPMLDIGLRFSVSGEQAWVRFNRWPILQPGDTYTNDELAQVPPELQRAILIRRFNPLITAIERRFGVKVRVDGFVAAAEMADMPFYAQLAIDNPLQGRSDLLLGLPASLAGLAGSVLDQLPSPANPDMESLTLTAMLEQGYCRLTLAELNALERGDVLFLLNFLRNDRQLQRVCFSREAHLYLLPKGTEEILQFVSSDSLGISGEKALEDLGDLQVEVTFSIGDVRVPISFLREMRPGYTVPAQRRNDGLVGIHINGQQIGTGQIVDINGRVGVRVVEIFGKSHGKPA